MRELGLSSHLAFFSQTLSDYRRLGALAPSSRRLAVRIARTVQGKARVVELGAGTGALTESLLEELPADGRLLAFEREPRFLSILHRSFRDPRATFTGRDAKELRAELARQGWAKPDAIVSGLPFQSFSKHQRHRILLEIRASLPPGGMFVAFQYGPALLPLFRRVFSNIRVESIEWANLPPAWVLVAEV